jgi:hypothetical protein
LPDPKPFDPFRAADASAIGTGLGCVSLVHFCESNSSVIAFVLQEVAQHGPAYIERGFAFARFDLPCGRDISDENRASRVDDSAGILVQRVLATVGDFGVDGPDLTIVN